MAPFMAGFIDSVHVLDKKNIFCSQKINKLRFKNATAQWCCLSIQFALAKKLDNVIKKSLAN